MYVEPILVSSFLHLLPLHSWSQQLYSPVSAAVEFARISWPYLSSCFILGRRKTKGTDKHRCISSYIYVSLLLLLIFFIPTLQLTHLLLSELCCKFPFCSSKDLLTGVALLISATQEHLQAFVLFTSFLDSFQSSFWNWAVTAVDNMFIHVLSQFVHVYSVFSCSKSTCMHLSPFLIPLTVPLLQ